MSDKLKYAIPDEKIPLCILKRIGLTPGKKYEIYDLLWSWSAEDMGIYIENDRGEILAYSRKWFKNVE